MQYALSLVPSYALNINLKSIESVSHYDAINTDCLKSSGRYYEVS